MELTSLPPIRHGASPNTGFQEAVSHCPNPPPPHTQTGPLMQGPPTFPRSQSPLPQKDADYLPPAHTQLHHNLCHHCNHNQPVWLLYIPTNLGKNMHMPGPHTRTGVHEERAYLLSCRCVFLVANSHIKRCTFFPTVTCSLSIYSVKQMRILWNCKTSKAIIYKPL